LTSQNTYIVQEKASLRISLSLPVPLATGCIFDIVFPSDFELSKNLDVVVTGMGLFGAAWTLTSIVSTAVNTITISNGCTSYWTANNQGTLDFNTIINP